MPGRQLRRGRTGRACLAAPKHRSHPNPTDGFACHGLRPSTRLQGLSTASVRRDQPDSERIQAIPRKATASTVSMAAATHCSVCGRSSFFGSARQQAALSQPARVERRRSSTSALAMKPEIHPKYFDEAKVICNGEEVLTTAGTKETYTVEIWSGNHPFYQGADNVALKEEGRVAAFNRKYAGFEETWGKAGIQGTALKFDGGLAKKKKKGKGKK